MNPSLAAQGRPARTVMAYADHKWQQWSALDDLGLPLVHLALQPSRSPSLAAVVDRQPAHVLHPR
jgi:hypothetical protein